MDNLMEINSPNIGSMNNLVEYQRLYINNKIGEALKSVDAKVQKESQMCFNDNFDLAIEALEKEFTLYLNLRSDVTIIEDNFIAEILPLTSKSENHYMIYILSSSQSECEKYLSKIDDVLDDYLLYFDHIKYNVWQYDNGSIFDTYLNKDTINNFDMNCVPFIENTDSFVKKFLKSDAPILIIYGEAGTGKSSFIKYLLNEMKRQIALYDDFEVAYSFDENIFYSNEFYHRILTRDFNALVLEDINSVIHKNLEEQEPNLINKLLSISDSVISNGKKIIISTNIESKHHLNEKLIRPGRCFDIVHFRRLETVEIDNLCDSYGVNIDYEINSMNLSEFFAYKNGDLNNELLNNKIGYVD